DETAAWRHYRDSVEPLRVLSHGPWVDMGSGAGYPGIPLAALRPDISITLVEPRRKRVSFLKTVVAELALDNVTVHEGRSTDTPLSDFGAVLTRATFSQAEDLEHLLQWCRSGGVVVALRKEASGTSGSRIYSYDLPHERRVMEVWTR
ncbi:MAG: RsmG family class I SAM-dependent methyltransferase, partial [Myxococcota bacterium]